MRAFDLAASRPWLIEPSWLETILEIASRENDSVEAVEKRLGRKLDNTYKVMVRDRVAVIPVTGPIFRRANLFSAISGATSTDILARDFTTALEDDSIRGILFDIDSPGGEAFGIPEFADMIFEARGTKPIAAYVGGLGASAAYWIASACDQVVCDQGSMLGSIGVVTAVRTGKNERQMEFVSSQSPNKRPDPETESGRAQIQQIVDDLGAVFITTVARNRDMTAEAVIEDFGRGGMLVGQKAVDAGLADRLGSLEGLIRELSAGEMAKPSPRKRKPAAAAAVAAPSGAEDSMNEKKPTGFVALMRAALGLSDDQAQRLDAMIDETAPAAPAASSREADLERELRVEREARGRLEARLRAEAAEGFVARVLSDSRALPAQRPAIMTLHQQLAEDDAARPLSTGSRVEALEQLFADSAPHTLTKELAAPEGSKVLDPVSKESDPVEADKAAAKAFYGSKRN